MNKIYIIVTLLSLLTANQAFAETKMICNIKNEIITNTDINNNLNFYKITNKKSVTEKEILNTLINQLLFQEEFKTYRITVTREEISEYLKNFSKEKIYNKSYIAWLKANNLPKDFLEKRAIYDLSLQKFIDQIIVPRINVTEHEINEHFRLIKIVDTFYIKQIIFDKDHFNNIYPNLQKINSCSEFDQVLRNNSIPVPSILKLTTQELDSNMYQFLSNLDEGHISQPIEGSDSSLQLFIICKTTFKDIKDDVKPRIKAMLIEKKVAQKLEQYLNILKKKVNIQCL